MKIHKILLFLAAFIALILFTHRVILPLAQAQSFSGVGNRVSSIILMLQDQEDAAYVATMLAGPDTQVLTWEELNRLILESVQNGLIFYQLQQNSRTKILW